MTHPYELRAVIAATLLADGQRTAPGAIAAADDLLAELGRQDPDGHDAYLRYRIAQAQLRRREAGR